MQNITRIGVSIPPKLLERFDDMTGEMGYANRSEAIRDAVREYMLKNEMRQEEGERVGVISLIYDHDVRGVNDVLIDLQHDYHEIIKSSIHQHMDEHNCLELIIVQGEVKKIKEIKDRLTSTAGVKHSDLMITNPTNY
ncbi:MAG: nickel-responsive regulator [Candidatus Altiarchaeales archaeon WOR_SM1_86-2]|nr:MAG: nickel-responsive regulator [Candidatus Altiarchaeales archaeon WOR_SM1_86-2]ODS39943.1 MAG: nickel-responsive regulator [Candidatus Altiarchaeales archaeon WOR_SM1_79]